MLRATRHWLRLTLAFLLTTASLIGLAPETAHAMPTVVVNHTGDASDDNPGDGHCDTGLFNVDLVAACTLRAAIEEANASVLVDEIIFDIPDADLGHVLVPNHFVIAPGSRLPDISTTMTIDATTQTGYVSRPLIVVSGSSAGGVDGFYVTSNSSIIRGLNIQGFADEGIEILGDSNQITESWIGVNVLGTSARPNDDGVLIRGSSNVIGPGNLLSGNLDDGVSIDAAADNTVAGNHIGTNEAGDGAIPNQGDGVAVQFGSSGNIISAGNVISGNNQAGVWVGAASATSILQSTIGVDGAGTSALPNVGDGIEVGSTASGVLISSNVISGNDLHGVDLHFGATGVDIEDNYIGTNTAGTAAVGNFLDGIRADADGVDIVDNLISGNGDDGIRLERTDSSVSGNRIGTDIAGTSPIPNGESGIDTGSGTGGSLIGGTSPADANIIAFNTGDGVSFRVHGSVDGALIGNSIFSNGELGIDIVAPNGQNTNDSGDIDTGPNDRINHPVITSAETTGPTAYLDFALDVRSGWHRVEFFTNPGGSDPSGFGEGEVFMGSINVNHPGGGSAGYSHTMPGTPGDNLTATVTRCANSACTTFVHTSEFSPSRTVVLGNTAPDIDPLGPFTVDELTVLGFTATVSDPDVGDTHVFGLTGEPAGASITASGVFSWTPSEVQGPGSYTFDVTVTDNGTPAPLNDTQPITIDVDEVNAAPVLTDPGSHNVDEHAMLSFTATASDADMPADTLTFSMSGGPAGASITPGGVFSWTPTETQGPGTYIFDITVSDDASPAQSDTKAVTITVDEVNTQPIINNPGNQTNAEADTVDLAIGATDSDVPANTFTYMATGLPPGLNIDTTSGQITGTVSYTANLASPHNTSITVTDNGNLADTANFTWTTPNTNRPPTLDPMGDHTTNELSQFNLHIGATDPDAQDTLAYNIAGQPAGATIDPNTGLFSWTPSELQGPGSYTFEVTVIDNGTPAPLSDTQPITITVDEVNTVPVANDDFSATDEDTQVTIDVIQNDTDADFNPLSIAAVTQPIHGSVGVSANKITYTPPANFNGTVEFTYTATDGHVGADAAVVIQVLAINDAPVVEDDEFRLVTYREIHLDVLDNDHDPDGDQLSIAFASLPEVGTITIDDDKVLYKPENGWIGSVRFSYVARDGSGAAASGSVEIVVGVDVLIGARDLAEDLGVDIVTFEPPTPNLEPDGIGMLNLDGMTLLAESFFQTVGALRVPLGFLGMTLLMVVGFGTASDVPALIFGARRKHWAVVRLGRQQRLPAYSEPGGRKVVYNYDPTAAGIVSTGRVRKVGKTEWLPVDTPNGDGWIYRKYLTEQVDLEAFSNDDRPVHLVKSLARRLRHTEPFRQLISPEGLIVALTGSPSQIAPDEIASLMNGSRLQALNGYDEFVVAVTQPFLDAYAATPEVTAEVPHSRAALMPTECRNFPIPRIGDRGCRCPAMARVFRVPERQGLDSRSRHRRIANSLGG